MTLGNEAGRIRRHRRPPKIFDEVIEQASRPAVLGALVAQMENLQPQHSRQADRTAILGIFADADRMMVSNIHPVAPEDAGLIKKTERRQLQERNRVQALLVLRCVRWERPAEPRRTALLRRQVQVRQNLPPDGVRSLGRHQARERVIQTIRLCLDRQGSLCWLAEHEDGLGTLRQR